MILSRNLLIREAAYDTLRTRTVLALKEINTIERYIKCCSSVCITKLPCDYDGCSHNPDSSSGICITAVMESLRIAENKIRQKKSVQVNAPKKTDGINKRGIYMDNILK